MQSAIASPEVDPIWEVYRQFHLITFEATPDFVNKVPRWYERAMELLPDNPVPILSQESFFETHIAEETMDFIGRCFYETTLQAQNKESDELSEEEWENIDQEMLDQHDELECAVVEDIGAVLNFYQMSYIRQEYTGATKHWKCKRWLVHNPIVEVW